MGNDTTVTKLPRGKRYILKKRAAAVDKLGTFGSALWQTYREAGFDPATQLTLPALPIRAVLDQLQNPWADKLQGGISIWELLQGLKQCSWVQIEPGQLSARGYLGEPNVRLRSTEDRKRPPVATFEALATNKHALQCHFLSAD